MNMTQVEVYYKSKLATDIRWAVKGMLKIYERQTEDEKTSEETKHDNGIGFSGCDANLLSSFSSQVLNGKAMSPKQMVYVFKKMPRYWKQLWNLTPAEKQEQIKNTAI